MLSMKHHFLCSAAATLLLCAFAGDASAQTADTLPEITVTAPSPIARRRAAAPAQPAAVSAAVEQNAAPPEPQQGILPIVTDQFATVTVVPKDEIQRSGGATLGDLLFSKPGITGSGFAPGAASRPIIRGLDGNRVGIVENGVSSSGVSELGEDHFVPVDPLAANQIEVIRGPAALRYGSTSIGGVVSASNNRIPDALPQCAVAPFQSYGLPAKAPVGQIGQPGCATVETRTSISSVDRGIDGAILLDAGGGNFAIHADAYGRKSGDYGISGNPYLSDPGHSTGGRQPNSGTQTSGASIGGSYIFDGGFIGAAITQNNALYHIPGIESADSRTRIDAQQTKFTAKGEYRPDAAAVEAIRFWLGVTDYKHSEIGADETNPALDSVHQTFTNKEQEARVEVQLTPFDARFAAVTTAVGVQVGHQELTAGSPENPGSLFNGLFNPNSNTRVSGYVFNELKFTDTTKAQIAGRIEHVSLSGSTPNFPGDYLPDGTAQFNQGRDLAFTPKSGSIGLIHNLPWGLVASITGQYVERAPKPAELFSRGAHDATATFDIGNPNLTMETAQTVEIGLRKADGPFRFEATAYYTKFSNFIYRRLTGAFCGEDFASCHQHAEEPADDGHGHGGTQQAVYTQRDATFRGGEFQSQLDVGALHGGIWGIESQFDVVRATFADGSNVPRIPPVRAGGGLFWRDASWLVRVNLLHAFGQNDVADIETTTPGYNLLKAEVSYKTKLDPQIYGARELMVGLVGNNLLNEDIRNSVSYTKNEVLMPGLGVRAFANVKF